MASPMVEGRVDPHKKAHYSLHISDRIAKKDSQTEGGAFNGVKCTVPLSLHLISGEPSD